MISQDKSEWQETLFHYQVMGFSEDEAFLAAMKEQGRKMLKDGAAGAITGTITAGGRLAGSKIGDGIQSYRTTGGCAEWKTVLRSEPAHPRRPGQVSG